MHLSQLDFFVRFIQAMTASVNRCPWGRAIRAMRQPTLAVAVKAIFILDP